MTIPLPTLDALKALTVATPCTVPWREMRGDNRSRFCGECRKPVYDLVAMTTAEAAALLAGPGGRPCVRLYRRPDGRVMTADCPVGLRGRVWRWARRRRAWAASLFALLFLPSCKTALQGLQCMPGEYPAFPGGDARPKGEGGGVPGAARGDDARAPAGQPRPKNALSEFANNEFNTWVPNRIWMKVPSPGESDRTEGDPMPRRDER
jgi:hypothetical protein